MNFIRLVVVLLILGQTGCSNEVEQAELNPKATVFIDDAMSALEAGFPKLALSFVDSALVAQSDHPIPHFLKGELLAELGNPDGADDAFREAISHNPDQLKAWFNLGNIAFSKREYATAIEHYEQEESVLDRNLKKYGTAFDVQYRESMSRAVQQQGRAHRQLANGEQALALFERAIALDSLNTEALVDMSQSLRDAGQEAGALKYAQRALRQQPLNPDYMYQVGALLHDIGRSEESVPLLQGALNQKPWLSEALYKLGLAMIQLGEEETGTGYVQMADSLQARNERIQKARFSAEQYADDPERWITLARYLIEVGRVEEAINPMTVAYSLDPQNLAIQNDLANLALIGGDTLVAIVRFEKILDKNPTYVDGWFNLGVIYALQGNYDEARLHWENTLQLDPSHQEAKTYLAQLGK